MDKDKTEEYFDEAKLEIIKNKVEFAANNLDGFFEDETDIKFLSLMRKAYNECYCPDNKNEWFLTQHFGAGMVFRNYLRTFVSDKEIGGNWDDHYMDVVNKFLDNYEKKDMEENK